MKWAAMITELFMGFQYIWKVKVKKDRKIIDVKLTENNIQKLNIIKKQ